MPALRLLLRFLLTARRRALAVGWIFRLVGCIYIPTSPRISDTGTHLHHPIHPSLEQGHLARFLCAESRAVVWHQKTFLCSKKNIVMLSQSKQMYNYLPLDETFLFCFSGFITHSTSKVFPINEPRPFLNRIMGNTFAAIIWCDILLSARHRSTKLPSNLLESACNRWFMFIRNPKSLQSIGMPSFTKDPRL